MFNFRIFDGKGKNNGASVTKDNELLTIRSPYPPLEPSKTRPYRQYFTDDGTSSGSSDMGVDGSSTQVDFYIRANGDDDRYITAINILVGYGTTGQHNEWADGTALTNGMRLVWVSEHGEVELHDGIKSNQDMFRLSFDLIPTNWEVRHVNASNDYGYMFSMDLTKMGLPYGIKLDAGTSQRLIMCVRDNAGTAADSFNVIGYGFERFK